MPTVIWISSAAAKRASIKYYENVGTSGAPAWRAAHGYFAAIDHSIYSAIALGRLDGDELPDAVVGDLSGNLFYHHNTGSGFEYDAGVFAGINLGAWSVPRLVDMDGDGDLDLVVGNEAGRLRYFENIGTGSMEWREVVGYFSTIDVGSNCSPTLGDYDRDGDIDLLTGDIGHELQYFRHVGTIWQEDPTVVAGLVVGQNAAPAFGDLDHDGDLDLAVGNYSGTFNYFENTGPVSSVPGDAEPGARPARLRASPNPFADGVTLTFNAAEGGSGRSGDLRRLRAARSPVVQRHDARRRPCDRVEPDGRSGSRRDQRRVLLPSEGPELKPDDRADPRQVKVSGGLGRLHAHAPRCSSP